jgi:hypothetical protein
MQPNVLPCGIHTARFGLVISLLLAVNLCISPGLVHAASPGPSNSENAVAVLNFHMYSLVYANSNSSMFIYNGADVNPPTYSTAPTTQVFCRIHQQAGAWFGDANVTSIWLGGVSWITQPLPEDVTIQGDVRMVVWMSAPEQGTAASGYAFGMSEADGRGNPIGEPSYQYYYSLGSVLSSSPTPFELTFTVDQTFPGGHIIGFFVIVGSTSGDWRFQVYFDSPNMNSFASLSVIAGIIPEFTQVGSMVMLVLAMGVACIISRRRNRNLSSCRPTSVSRGRS